MLYCVAINTTKIVDGSDNPEEVMIENAINSGYKKEEVEIITEEEYKLRIEQNPIVNEKTPIEILQNENEQLKQSIAELTVLVSNMIGGTN